MAMTPAGLKSFIIAQMSAQGFNVTNPATGGEGEKYIEALSIAIVTYIQAEAQASVSTPGGGSSDGLHSII